MRIQHEGFIGSNTGQHWTAYWGIYDPARNMIAPCFSGDMDYAAEGLIWEPAENVGFQIEDKGWSIK